MNDVERERPLWGIHGGQAGEADSLFLQKKQVALGFERLRDLSQLPPSREAFKDAVAKAYTEARPGAVPNYAGQLFRFVHEMKEGDLIAYPSKLDRRIHFGEIAGPYQFVGGHDVQYPHQRAVRWLKEVARTDFSQGALYEIGSALTLFQLRNYGEEFRAAIKGRISAPPVAQDESVSVAAEVSEESTRDFVLKTLAQELKGHPFAAFVAHLLEKMGYHTRLSPPGPDSGIDIVAHKDELGFEPPIIKVQVKSNDRSNIGEPDVAALYGKAGQGEHALVVTLGGFTKEAKSLARNRTNLRLIDGSELVQLILAHYEELDSRYKSVLPLRRVYIPQRIEEPKR